MAKVKFYIYKITTPIIQIIEDGQDKLIPNYFNFKTLDFCIKRKYMKERIDRIKTYNNSKTMVLDIYNDNYSDLFAYGEFSTVAHGYQATSIEIVELTETKSFTDKEGILNKVKFFINKDNGYIYIEHDRNAVITMDRIRRYFTVMGERKIYYTEFNNLNKNYYIDTNKSMYNIQLLPPKTFIEQIRNMKRVKSIQVTPVYDSSNNQDNPIDKLRSEALANNVGNYEATINMHDFDNERLSEELANFIEYLSTATQFEDLRVQGMLGDNVLRVFTNETATKDLIVETDLDIFGWTSTDSLFQVLSEKISDDEQLCVTHRTNDEIIDVDIDNL